MLSDKQTQRSEPANRIDNARAYDAISDDWQRSRSATPANACIVDFVRLLRRNGHVLDVGCGTGYPIAQYLSSCHFFVTGIDISPAMIQKAKALHLPHAEFIEQDFLTYTSDCLYDGIIAFDSLWHIAKEKQPAIYPKLASLMRPGAYVIFTHGKRDDETTGMMYDQEFYYSALETEEVRLLMAQAGLTVLSLTENYREPTTGDRDLLVVAQKQ